MYDKLQDICSSHQAKVKLDVEERQEGCGSEGEGSVADVIRGVMLGQARMTVRRPEYTPTVM